MWNTLQQKITSLHLGQWFSFSDLISINPPVEWKFREVYIGFVAICLILALVFSFLKIHPTLKSRLLNFFWTNAILGGILYFFRSQGVPLLGMDIWRTLQELGFVIWAFSIFRYQRTGLQQELVTEKVLARKNKYLPKPKQK